MLGSVPNAAVGWDVRPSGGPQPAWLVEGLCMEGCLALVVATGTLALGIHVPCRAAVFWADSPHLLPLAFRRLAGGAVCSRESPPPMLAYNRQPPRIRRPTLVSSPSH